jgi:hypothetical protein
MGPVVHQLEQAYAGRVVVRKFVMDTITPGTADFDDMKRLGALAGFRVTPTFVVVDAQGAVVGKYEGVTSYLTLRRDLETALAANASAR